MKYKCIRGVVTTAGITSVGQVVELPANEAADLMSAGKIIPHNEEPVMQDRVAVVEHREPLRRGRKPKYVA